MMLLLRSCIEAQSQDDWVEFVRRLQPVIAAAILRTFARYQAGRRPARDVVDDLVQQTYIRLCAGDYRALRNFLFGDEAGLMAYTRTVASNLTIDYLRSGLREFEPVDPNMEGGGQPAEQFVLVDAIETHLAECSGPDAVRNRHVFWLYYRRGLTSKAISQIASVGLSQKGVESLLLRLARCVRRAMAEGIRGSKTFRAEGGPVGQAT
jgi:RNA polymerase sigma-70 factor, ECF subfamily